MRSTAWPFARTAVAAVVGPAALHAQAIGGRVLEPTRGTPLGGVRTSVRVPGGDSTVVTTTGRDGTFILMLPTAGRYQLHLALDSLTDFASDSIDVGPDDFVQKEFRLTPPAPAFSERQVEKPVRALLSNAGPRYPADLRERNVEGEVLAQFVVDTTGHVRPGSFRALRGEELGFVAAVRQAVYAMRFRPAEIGGRKVPQLVQQPFHFRLSHTPPGFRSSAPVP